MTLLAFKNFGSDVVRSAANRSFPFAVEFKFGCQTKITNLYFHFVIKEKITEFQISVDNTMAVQVFDGRANLIYVALDFKLM